MGDTIVVAGTKRVSPPGRVKPGSWNYDLHMSDEAFEDVRTIEAIDSDTNRVYLSAGLKWDHTTPPHSREGLELKAHVANVTRNASIETAEEHRDFTHYERSSRHPQIGYRHMGRGHVMFMHNKDVQIHHGGFYHLGRTNKGGMALDDTMLDEHGDVTSVGTNQRARYALHFHRAGAEDTAATVHGSSVVDSVGWGYVNHGSNAVFTNNVAYDVNGAAYVTERGDETGAFINNISIKNQSPGVGGNGGFASSTAEGPGVANFGVNGHGLWSQGPLVVWRGNIVSGARDAVGMIHVPFDGITTADIEAKHGQKLHEIPFTENIGTTVYGSGRVMNFHIYHPGRGRTQITDFRDFLAWNVSDGISANYASGMRFQDLVMISDPADPGQTAVGRLVLHGKGHIEGFVYGYKPSWNSTIGDKGLGIDGYFLKNYINIDATFGNSNNGRSDIRVRDVVFETPDEQYWSIMQSRTKDSISMLPDPDTGILTPTPVPITGPANVLARFDHVPDTQHEDGQSFSVLWLVPKRMSFELEVDGQVGLYELMFKDMQHPDFVLYPEELGYDNMPDLFYGWTNEQWHDVSSSTMVNGKWKRPDGSVVKWFDYSLTAQIEEGYSGKQWAIEVMDQTLGGDQLFKDPTGAYTGIFPGWNLAARGELLPRDWSQRDEYLDGEQLGFDGVVLKRLGDVTWDDETIALQTGDDFISGAIHSKDHSTATFTFDPKLTYANDVNVDGHLIIEAVNAGMGLTRIYSDMNEHLQHGELNYHKANVTYTPDEGFYGTDSYRYRFVDAIGHDAWGTVYLHARGGLYHLPELNPAVDTAPAPGITLDADRVA
ncbi:Ig-like domain-containing protein, partial [Planctomycetota bacterium]